MIRITHVTHTNVISCLETLISTLSQLQNLCSCRRSEIPFQNMLIETKTMLLFLETIADNALKSSNLQFEDINSYSKDESGKTGLWSMNGNVLELLKRLNDLPNDITFSQKLEMLNETYDEINDKKLETYLPTIAITEVTHTNLTSCLKTLHSTIMLIQQTCHCDAVKVSFQNAIIKVATILYFLKTLDEDKEISSTDEEESGEIVRDETTWPESLIIHNITEKDEMSENNMDSFTPSYKKEIKNDNIKLRATSIKNEVDFKSQKIFRFDSNTTPSHKNEDKEISSTDEEESGEILRDETTWPESLIIYKLTEKDQKSKNNMDSFTPSYKKEIKNDSIKLRGTSIKNEVDFKSKKIFRFDSNTTPSHKYQDLYPTSAVIPDGSRSAILLQLKQDRNYTEILRKQIRESEDSKIKHDQQKLQPLPSLKSETLNTILGTSHDSGKNKHNTSFDLVQSKLNDVSNYVHDLRLQLRNINKKRHVDLHHSQVKPSLVNQSESLNKFMDETLISDSPYPNFMTKHIPERLARTIRTKNVFCPESCYKGVFRKKNSKSVIMQRLEFLNDSIDETLTYNKKMPSEISFAERLNILDETINDVLKTNSKHIPLSSSLETFSKSFNKNFLKHRTSPQEKICNYSNNHTENTHMKSNDQNITLTNQLNRNLRNLNLGTEKQSTKDWIATRSHNPYNVHNHDFDPDPITLKLNQICDRTETLKSQLADTSNSKSAIFPHKYRY